MSASPLRGTPPPPASGRGGAEEPLPGCSSCPRLKAVYEDDILTVEAIDDAPFDPNVQVEVVIRVQLPAALVGDLVRDRRVAWNPGLGDTPAKLEAVATVPGPPESRQIPIL